MYSQTHDFRTRDLGTHSKLSGFGISYGTLHIDFWNEQNLKTQRHKQTSNMTTSNVSTAVKIVVSMVVVAALVATRFSSIKVRR
jgi:hypothetical protein